jgi:hypothetical protein
MPHTTSRQTLGITVDELERGRRLLKDDQEHQRRTAVSVTFKDRTYSDDPLDLRKLVEAVKDDAQVQRLPTSIEPLALAEMMADAREDHERGERRRTNGRRASSAPAEKTRAVGIAGEVLVGEWLHRLTGKRPEVTWVSGFRRELLADGVGGDDLGYDFVVERGSSTLLIEVKATTDDATEIKLGESEVRRAQDLAPDEEYVIVLVTNVLDPNLRRILTLPNPFGPGGLKRYRVAGRAMRLHFALNPNAAGAGS